MGMIVEALHCEKRYIVNREARIVIVQNKGRAIGQPWIGKSKKHW
jgi:hypothetical protein